MADERPLRVFIAGHAGMVGAALVRSLSGAKGVELITRTRGQLDLSRQDAVNAFFEEQSIDQVYLAAARVGGIHANDRYPAEFIHQNLLIETHVVHAAFKAGVKRLLMLGSSCIYPRQAPQPMVEEALLTGTLEPTNEPYAIAKIAGIKLCESYNRQYGTDFRSLMPTNLYGPGDNFDLENSHVLPALLRRFHQARQNHDASVTVWGSGRPRREFLHVDDLAAACRFIMELKPDAWQAATHPRCSHLNVGSGEDITIAALAEQVADTVGYSGAIRFDDSRPDGAPRKLLDVSKMNRLGWTAAIPLQRGIEETWQWMVRHWAEISAA
jgi:GDP-L-fucose synthase